MNSLSTISFPGRLTPAETRIASQASSANLSFRNFVWKERANRAYLVIALTGTIIQFVVFKFLYPFPDFFSDSYSYLFAASAHLDISIWPIGYSKFLAAFHTLTHSDTALVAFQYCFLELSALYFFFSWIYFFSPSRTTRTVLFIFLLFNPLLLFLGNYVNSDPIFLALSLLWFTELIWIIQRPRLYQIFTQGILLFLAFTVRNNAYYYPVIAAIAYILSRQPRRIKMLGILLPFVLLIPFIIHTRDAAKELTGTKQFSLFTGWQLANNALYMYDKINIDTNQLPSATARELNRRSLLFYRMMSPDFHNYLATYEGNFFIRTEIAPLKQYLFQHYDYSNEMDGNAAWGSASAIFDEFGSWLIIHYPWQYARYFMLLNVRNYFLPPLEKLQIYNLGLTYVFPIAVSWFEYPGKSVKSFSPKFQGSLFKYYPTLFFIVNIYVIGMLILFLIKGFYKRLKTPVVGSILVITILLIANFIFCVFATMIVFRYQAFPFLLLIPFASLLVEASGNNSMLTKENLIPKSNIAKKDRS